MENYECAKCGCKHFYVDYTRQKANYIQRKKHCRNCGTVIWTKEVIQNYRKSK